MFGTPATSPKAALARRNAVADRISATRRAFSPSIKAQSQFDWAFSFSLGLRVFRRPIAPFVGGHHALENLFDVGLAKAGR
jgi:hypothetical protein